MNTVPRSFLLLLIALTTGCTMLPYQAKQKPQLENPRPDIDEVILAPVHGSPHAGDLTAWENQFHHQLLDVSGIRKVDRAISENDSRLTPTPSTAVLWVTVLDFDAYYPTPSHPRDFLPIPDRSEKSAEQSARSRSDGDRATGHARCRKLSTAFSNFESPPMTRAMATTC